jgi:uncharacterized membrane protein
MRWSGWVPVAILIAAVLLIGDAVVRGTASVALFVFIPVLSGDSTEFLLGVVLLLVGFLSIPLAFLSGYEAAVVATPIAPRARGETPSGEVGGLILIGPFPFFFGSWKNVSLRTKLVAAVVGVLLLVAVVVAVVLR